MKNLSKLIPLCGFVAALVAFILMIATDAIVVSAGKVSVGVSGSSILFGADGVLGGRIDPVAIELVAWILALVGLVLVLASAAFVFLKEKTLGKYATLLNCLAGLLFVAAGIIAFTVVGSAGYADLGGSIGAGWLIAGILYLVGGVACVCPLILGFLKK